MQPGGGNSPTLGLLQQIEKDFGSFTNFREKFTEAALTLFGSGWIWLVCELFLDDNKELSCCLFLVLLDSFILHQFLPLVCNLSLNVYRWALIVLLTSTILPLKLLLVFQHALFVSSE